MGYLDDKRDEASACGDETGCAWFNLGFTSDKPLDCDGVGGCGFRSARRDHTFVWQRVSEIPKREQGD